MKHLTDPLSAKEIRDSLGVTDEDLEAARRAIAETQQRATESGCGAVVLWVGVFVAGVVIGYLL